MNKVVICLMAVLAAGCASTPAHDKYQPTTSDMVSAEVTYADQATDKSQLGEILSVAKETCVKRGGEVKDYPVKSHNDWVADFFPAYNAAHTNHLRSLAPAKMQLAARAAVGMDETLQSDGFYCFGNKTFVSWNTQEMSRSVTINEVWGKDGKMFFGVGRVGNINKQTGKIEPFTANTFFEIADGSDKKAVRMALDGVYH